MNYDDVIQHSLRTAHEIYRKFLLGKPSSSLSAENVIRLQLCEDLEKVKGIGWLSVNGREDKFIGRGGAWVCINLIMGPSELEDSDQLEAIITTIFSHRIGASLGNIIVMGQLKFENGERFTSRLQANGSYSVTKNGMQFKTLQQCNIATGLRNEDAIKYADRFGMPR